MNGCGGGKRGGGGKSWEGRGGAGEREGAPLAGAREALDPVPLFQTNANIARCDITERVVFECKHAQEPCRTHYSFSEGADPLFTRAPCVHPIHTISVLSFLSSLRKRPKFVTHQSLFCPLETSKTEPQYHRQLPVPQRIAHAGPRGFQWGKACRTSTKVVQNVG